MQVYRKEVIGDKAISHVLKAYETLLKDAWSRKSLQGRARFVQPKGNAMDPFAKGIGAAYSFTIVALLLFGP
jgi:hypothetical protein